MAYEKHTWQTGETITAEKLNNLEDGASRKENLFVNFTKVSGHNYTSDKTFQEISEAYRNGVNIYACADQYYPCHLVRIGTTYAIFSSIFVYSVGDDGERIQISQYTINSSNNVTELIFDKEW